MGTKHTKVLVIGAGPAGYTAAIYAARANQAPLVVQGPQPGGQLTITADVENFPGFPEPVPGPTLMQNLEAQARNVGAEIVTDTIVEVDLDKRPFTAKGEGGDVYTADSLIIATGAQARWLGIESETKFRGFGVSGCATCDGFFYRGKEVVVVGGGNSALEETLFLTHFATKVTLVHRRDSFRGEKILHDRVMAHPKIEVVWDSVIDEVLGDEKPHLSVTGVRLKNVKTGETRDLSAHGVFIAIGHTPATALFKGKLDTDEEGYLIVKPGTPLTKIPGVFAAGDVADRVYRQAVTAAGMGCMAALEAERFLGSQQA